MVETPCKRCAKCGETKPLSAFYKHPNFADGHFHKCKECHKQDVTANRKENLDHYRAYDRSRRKRDCFDTEEDWKEFQAKLLLKTREYRERFPKKYKAHGAVNNAIADGTLIPQPCEICGNHNTVAHHCDYDKPLDVTWLCPVHHATWHTEHGEALNGV